MNDATIEVLCDGVQRITNALECIADVLEAPRAAVDKQLAAQRAIVAADDELIKGLPAESLWPTERTALKAAEAAREHAKRIDEETKR